MSEQLPMPWFPNDGGRLAAGYAGDTGDCVTRAIAIAAQIPYQSVYNRINEISSRERLSKNKKDRSSARAGVYKSTYKWYLEELGWLWTPTMHIGSGCRVHLRPGEIPMEGRLIVSLSQHLVAVVDGVVQDTYDPSRMGTRCVYGLYRPPESFKVQSDS